VSLLRAGPSFAAMDITSFHLPLGALPMPADLGSSQLQGGTSGGTKLADHFPHSLRIFREERRIFKGETRRESAVPWYKEHIAPLVR
jgi:hypothetical protein